jgi:hypothetical protein
MLNKSKDRIKTVCEEIFQMAFYYKYNGGWILSRICGRICGCMTPLLRKYVWTKELAPEEKEKDEKRRAYLKSVFAEQEKGDYLKAKRNR